MHHTFRRRHVSREATQPTGINKKKKKKSGGVSPSDDSETKFILSSSVVFFSGGDVLFNSSWIRIEPITILYSAKI